MKLQKLTINNFRGLKGKNNIIDFSSSDIVFLIGQNNAGKSSFLRAYEFFIDPSKKAERNDFYDYNETNQIEIIGEFLKEIEDEKDEDLKGTGKTAEENWDKKWVDEKGIIRIKKVWTKFGALFDKYTFDPIDTKDWIKNGFGGLHTHLSHRAPQAIAINAMETEQTLEDKVNKIINDEFLKVAKDEYPDNYKEAISTVRALQDKIIGAEEIRKYNANLNKYFSKIFVDLSLEIKPKDEDQININDALKKSHSIDVLRNGHGRKENFAQYGHGVIRQALFNFLAFLKNLSENNRKQYLILFEEPELFLHPKVSYALRESLYNLSDNSPYQILCATHSPLMIDVSRKHASLIRVIKNDNEETQTFQVGDEIFQKSEYKKTIQMINRFNSNICEAFYANNVFLVEGDTEAVAFRDILDRFYHEKDIYVLNTGSKTNIPFFQEILTHFRINHTVFHDTDDKSKKSSWTLNQKIWDLVMSAQKIDQSLSCRYVFTNNFEIAHNYEFNKEDGKVVTAYDFAQTITNENNDLEFLNYLKDYFGDKKIIHNQEYINLLFDKK